MQDKKKVNVKAEKAAAFVAKQIEEEKHAREKELATQEEER